MQLISHHSLVQTYGKAQTGYYNTKKSFIICTLLIFWNSIYFPYIHSSLLFCFSQTDTESCQDTGLSSCLLGIGAPCYVWCPSSLPSPHLLYLASTYLSSLSWGTNSSRKPSITLLGQRISPAMCLLSTNHTSCLVRPHLLVTWLLHLNIKPQRYVHQVL